MTQRERILERPQTGEWLSAVQASREMYTMRLGTRIEDLRAEGHENEERRLEKKSYSEYRLRPTRSIELPPAFEPKAEAKARFL
jgi:hypothetical protein